MALSAANHYEVRADATANNVNGGGFNPTNANMFTDLTTDSNTANTASPVVSSASYNFAAGDVGALLYIKSGTNWTPGWYKIASVASNKATLNAAVGAATLFATRGLNTVVGCATVGTPTNGTFSIDYSSLTAAILNAKTDGAASGTTTFTGSSFTKAMVGNLLHITVGGGLSVGWYEIVSFTNATTVVLDRNPGTGSSATYYVGGALSLNSTLDDDFFDTLIAGATVWVNATGGTVAIGEAVDFANQGSNQFITIVWGFASVRGDNPTGSTRPLINGGANTYTGASACLHRNLRFTGTASAVLGNSGGDNRQYWWVKATNTSTTADRVAIQSPGSIIWLFCEAVSYFGRALNPNGSAKVIGCWIHSSKTCIDCSSTNGNTVGIWKSIISDFVTTGIGTAAGLLPLVIEACTIHGANNTRGTGIDISSTTESLRCLIANIISGCATGVVGGVTEPITNVDEYNNYYNNDLDATANKWTKGATDTALNPSFTSVGQVTGTTGKFDAGGSKLIDTSKNFTTLGVVVGDLVYVASGTGVSNAMFFGVTSISTTTNPNDTLNLDVSPGTNTTADKVYEIELGHNFLPTNTDLLTGGFPQATFPGGFTPSFPAVGAVASETGGSSGGGVSVFIG
jgi:hypothetical protein